MRGASKVTLQTHQILRLPRNLEAQDFSGYSLNASANRKTIRGYPRISDDNPNTKSSSRTRRFGDLTLPILETILYCKIQHFALRLSPKMSRNAAPATKSHPPTSPNTAPATQNESHPSSASHMKRHFQCAEPIQSPSNISKYCACHAKWMSTVLLYETSTLRDCNFTDLLLCGSITFTDLLLFGTVILPIYYFADLLLLPIYYFADLLLYRSVTLVMCYFTELVLCGTVTLRNYYFTDLLL